MKPVYNQSLLKPIFAGFLVAAVSISAMPDVLGATIDWVGGTSADWSNAANWSGATTPPTNDLTTDIANFNLATYGGNPVFNPNTGTREISGITLGSTNGAMNIDGTVLDIGGNGLSISNGAGALTINPRVDLRDHQTWSLDSTNVTVNGQIQQQNANIRILTVNGTGLLELAGGVQTHQGNSGNDKRLRFDGNGTILISGVVDTAGSGGKTELETASTFSGTVTLTNNNSYSIAGQTGTVHRNGTMQVGNDAALGLGNVSLSGTNATTFGNLQATGGPRNLANGFSIGTAGGISGTEDITFNGTNSVAGTGVNFSGAVGALLEVSNTGTTTFTNPFNHFKSDNSGNPRRFYVDTTTASTELNFNGGIDITGGHGDRDLEKRGPGTLRLGGISDYDGDTSVVGGTLLVNGTLAPGGLTVTVSSGATLGGNGTINRNVTMSTGSTLSPGDASADTLSIVGNLNLGANSFYDFDLESGSADMTAVTGNLIIGDGLTVDLTDLGGGVDGNYDLFTYTGSFTGDLATWSILSTDMSVESWGSLIDTGSAIQLQGITLPQASTAVPEPHTLAIWSLLGLAAAGFGCMRYNLRK